MRTLPIAAVGLLLLGQGAAHADPPAPSGQGNSWWPPNWFAKPAPKPAEPPPTARVDDRAKLPPPAGPVLVSREVEEKAWLRRWAVCDRIRQIAADTGDEALQRRADLLVHRAWNLYQQRTAGLESGSRAGDRDGPGQPTKGR